MGRRDILRGRRVRRLLAPAVALASMGTGSLILTAPAAQATGTTVGYACAYSSSVSLFGGPFGTMGCGTQTSVYANANSAAPSSTWSYGVSSVVTDPDGAKAQYGPADMLSSPWDVNDQTQNTGLLKATTNGTDTVQAVAKANGVGPSPFYTSTPTSADNPSSPAGYVQTTCQASNPTTYSGSTTISKGFVDTKLDANGYPITTVPVPVPLPKNYRVDFTIDNVGDHGHMVFNERVLNADGSYTVNGSHMYLEGPTAFGDVIIAQVTCGHA